MRAAYLVPLTLSALLAIPAAGGEPKSKPVEVTNLPAVQDVAVVSGGCQAGSAQLVGFTEAEVAGSAGFFSLLAACSAEFPGSRVCRSAELLALDSVPAGLSGRAWVMPSFQPVGSTNTVDASGVTTGSEYLACNGWASTGFSGLTVDDTGAFRSDGPCSTPRPVACCTE